MLTYIIQSAFEHIFSYYKEVINSLPLRGTQNENVHKCLQRLRSYTCAFFFWHCLPPNVSGTRPRNKLFPVISPYAPAMLSYPGTYAFQGSSIFFAFAASGSVGAFFASSSSALVSGKNGPKKCCYEC